MIIYHFEFEQVEICHGISVPENAHFVLIVMTRFFDSNINTDNAEKCLHK